MSLLIESKKLKRTGYLPSFLAGGFLAAAFPVAYRSPQRSRAGRKNIPPEDFGSTGRRREPNAGARQPIKARRRKEMHPFARAPIRRGTAERLRRGLLRSETGPHPPPRSAAAALPPPPTYRRAAGLRSAVWSAPKRQNSRRSPKLYSVRVF